MNADSLLLPRARAGDTDALAELMREYGGVVRRLVSGFVRDVDDARDVEQDTWIRAAANLHQLRDDGRFAPWLKSIARTTSLNFLASRRRTQQRVSSFEQCGTTDFADDGPDGSPEASTLSLDNQRKVWEVLGSLSERDRTALFLRESRDMPYEEIAARLGVSRNAAEVCVFRARERFRKLFATIENRPQRCGLDPLRLSSLIDAEADTESARALHDHVATCEGCSQRLAAMQSGRSLYRKMAGLLLPFGGWNPVAALSGAWSKALTTLGLGGSAGAAAAGGGAASATVAGTTTVAGAATAATAGATATAGVAAVAGLNAPLFTGVAAVVVTVAVTAGIVTTEPAHLLPSAAPLAALAGPPAPDGGGVLPDASAGGLSAENAVAISTYAGPASNAVPRMVPVAVVEVPAEPDVATPVGAVPTGVVTTAVAAITNPGAPASNEADSVTGSANSGSDDRSRNASADGGRGKGHDEDRSNDRGRGASGSGGSVGSVGNDGGANSDRTSGSNANNRGDDRGERATDRPSASTRAGNEGASGAGGARDQAEPSRGRDGERGNDRGADHANGESTSSRGNDRGSDRGDRGRGRD